jgi:50S ribosome-binding GTPase
MIALTGDLEWAFARLGLREPRTGEVALMDLAGIDRGLVARWTATSAHVMPHGGPLIVASIAQAFTASGIVPASQADDDPDAWHDRWPEATDEVEARMLDALAETPSPLAIDLLLDQPRRWREMPRPDPRPDEHDRVLRRLIWPPLIAAIGPPNIGKSSLVNALARASVSLVADHPGTTRDHVGAAVIVDGLSTWLLDCPGVPEGELRDPLEQAAIEQAIAAAHHADLLLLCVDAGAGPIDLEQAPAPLRGLLSRARERTLCLALRIDRGKSTWPYDLGVSAHTGDGLEALAHAIRQKLVPDSALQYPRPWIFWESPAPAPKIT